MRIVGIDPGLDGALALYEPGADTLRIVDMPTLEITKSSGGKRRVVDSYAIANLFDEVASERLIVFIEQSWPRPTDGAIAGFGFGMNYGILIGACAAHFLRIETVSPQRWKRSLNVVGDKDDARARASVLMPNHSTHWPLKKHHGRAEAALIALYGARNLQQVAA